MKTGTDYYLVGTRPLEASDRALIYACLGSSPLKVVLVLAGSILLGILAGTVSILAKALLGLHLAAYGLAATALFPALGLLYLARAYSDRRLLSSKNVIKLISANETEAEAIQMSGGSFRLFSEKRMPSSKMPLVKLRIKPSPRGTVQSTHVRSLNELEKAELRARVALRSEKPILPFHLSIICVPLILDGIFKGNIGQLLLGIALLPLAVGFATWLIRQEKLQKKSLEDPRAITRTPGTETLEYSGWLWTENRQPAKWRYGLAGPAYFSRGRRSKHKPPERVPRRT